MEKFDLGVYGSGSKTYGGTMPVWRHIDNDGTEMGGGTYKVTASFAAEYPAGTIIPVGTPVNLKDRVLTILPTYEVTDAYAATVATIIKVNANGIVRAPKVGDIVMLAPATVSTTGTAVAITAVALVAEKYELTIGAAGLGAGIAAAVGDILVGGASAGTGKMIAVVPTGLTRREVSIGEGATSATGASVFHGEILVDRIPPIPACVKAVLPMIKFTNE